MNVSVPIRRFAALGLLLAVLWVAWTALASPMLDSLAMDRKDIARSLQLLTHYSQLKESAPALESQRAILLSSPTDTSFLQGIDPSLIAAEMQAMAARLASSSDAVIQSSRTLPGIEEEGFWKAEVLLELQASPSHLRQILYGIMSNQPVIFIEKLNIHAAEDGTAMISSDEQPLASIQLQLASYALFKHTKRLK